MRIRPVSFSCIAGIGAVAAMWAILLAMPAAAQTSDDIRRVAGKMAPSDPMESEDLQPSTPPLVAPDANLEITERTRVVPQLLMSEQEMRVLLGRDPDFIYDPAGREDPMLIPWVHLRVMAQEYHRIAEAAIAQSNWERATQAYHAVFRLLDQVQSPWIHMKTFDELRTRATAGLASVENLRTKSGVAFLELGAVEEGQLPAWVQNSTTAVILDARDPVCLVGPHTLRVGDEIPGQPVKVVVVKIERNAVHYKVGENIFVVEVGKERVVPPRPEPRRRR